MGVGMRGEMRAMVGKGKASKGQKGSSNLNNIKIHFVLRQFSMHFFKQFWSPSCFKLEV